MTAADRLATAIATIPTVRSETGVFVSMDGPLAVVNLGGGTVTIPCVGFYPPAVGMTVQVEWRDGRPAVTGPAAPQNPLGEVTGTGSSTVTVDVDGTSYDLYYQSGYSPQVGDTVEINWTTGIVQGKVTGTSTPDVPDTAPPPASGFTLRVKATSSGRYQGSWWGTDPWASNNNDGIWVYGNRVRDAIKGASITRIEIYLPLLSKLGNCAIGTHPHGSIPGGAPSISNTVNLPANKRNGWVGLPLSFATYLAAGGRGIGVTTDVGLNKWRGVPGDSDSGALRFTGTR